MDSFCPEVTVIIPTIGRPKYLPDTLRSVLRQKYGSLKILISDNAPSISSTTILAQQNIHDSRIRIVARPQRMPFSEHMNACLADVDSEFVMILSDDDQLSDGYVAGMVEMFFADPGVTVGLGPQSIVGEDEIGLLTRSDTPIIKRTFDGLAFLKGTLGGKLNTAVVTYFSLFARRLDILAAGGFKNYPDGSHADNFILFQLALRGRVALGSQFMFYRVYSNSHGLGTPFPALLEATKAYLADCIKILKFTAVNEMDKASIIRMTKNNCAGMLRGRLRTIYLNRVSKILLFQYIFSALIFTLTPAHLL